MVQVKAKNLNLIGNLSKKKNNTAQQPLFNSLHSVRQNLRLFLHEKYEVNPDV